MSLWRWTLTISIVGFFVGIPILCLFLPLTYGFWLLQGYMVLSVIWFIWQRLFSSPSQE